MVPSRGTSQRFKLLEGNIGYPKLGYRSREEPVAIDDRLEIPGDLHHDMQIAAIQRRTRERHPARSTHFEGR